MGTMLYTKDAELAVTVALRPKKGVFDGTKVACFYHTFEDEDLDAAKSAGWVDFKTLLNGKPISPKPDETQVKAKLEGELPMKKHRGRGKYDVWDKAGVLVGDNVTGEEADIILSGLDK